MGNYFGKKKFGPSIEDESNSSTNDDDDDWKSVKEDFDTEISDVSLFHIGDEMSDTKTVAVAARSSTALSGLQHVDNHHVKLKTHDADQQIELAVPPLKISFDLGKDEILGRGKFGVRVYRARDKLTGKEITVKRLINAYSPELEQQLNCQITNLHDELPKHVVRPYCAVGHTRDLYIVLQHFGETIDDFVAENCKTNLNRFQILRQILIGVNFLQTTKVTQKCLSLNSILVSPSSENVRVAIDPQLENLDEGNVIWHDGPYTGPIGIRISGGLELSRPYNRNEQQNKSAFELNELDIQGKDFFVATQKYTLPEFLELCMVILTFSKRKLSRLGLLKMDRLDSVSRLCLKHPHMARLKLDCSPENEVFFLGSIFYFVLTGGDNPFLWQVERDFYRDKDKDEPVKWHNNIRLKLFEDRSLYMPLLAKMLNWNPGKRPSIEVILKHPAFWDPSKICEFLSEVSDRLKGESDRLTEETKSLTSEIAKLKGESNKMNKERDKLVTRLNKAKNTKDTKTAEIDKLNEEIDIIKTEREKKNAESDRLKTEVDRLMNSSPMLKKLEIRAAKAVTINWGELVDEEIIEINRGYANTSAPGYYNSVQTLLRLIRNMKSHFREVSEVVRNRLKAGLEEENLPAADYVANYFTTRFPELLAHVYYGMEEFKRDQAFARFYDQSFSYEWCNGW